MAGGYRVDLDELEATAIRIRGFVEHLQDQLDELDRRISDLHVTWSGTAARAHREAHDHWSAGAREMRNGVESMKSAAEQAHSSYSAAVAANLRMFGGM
ncbi:WXG100 family type VII secretion target [Rhodococcus sp. PvR044]|uniref:WXG100 family type VII secretion target n=1 Tax=Rhodococcus sp. PvR044 TaxID=3156402 RepID=UPI00339A45B7